MAVRIGHASIDENGKAQGGAAGDQSGKELCTRDWYSKGWNVLLRPKSSTLAALSAKACEDACENTRIGYDQWERNTLYAKAKAADFDISKIESGCECDCSSLMHVCAIAGGANLTYGSNGYTTSTMAAAFKASGDYERLTDSKYLTSDKYLKRGDILVKEGSHTVMVLSNGSAAADQFTAPKQDLVRVYYSVRLPLLVKGMEGEDVRTMQQLLIAKGYKLPRYGADGEFGGETEETLLRYQKAMSLKTSGQCGPDTWGAMLGLTGVG